MLNLDDIKTNGIRLGSGGAAEVYRYELPESRYGLPANTPVAVKIYKSSLIKAIPTQLDRMQREFDKGNSIDHPNIVKTYDFGQTTVAGEATHYLVMECIEGGTLRDYIKRTHPLAPDATEKAFLQLASGLEELHKHGLIHRDIKPDNVLVDPENEVFKISDLGVVSDESAEAMTSHGVFLGTIRYAAPEYLNSSRNSHYDSRIDLYSLGLSLYFLISNKDPFFKYEPYKWLAQLDAAKHDYPSPAPTFFNKGTPDWWNGLVYALISKEPTARPTIEEIKWLFRHLQEHKLPSFKEWAFDSDLKPEFDSL